MTSTWHIPSETLEEFARSPERMDPTIAASVEQHLLRCPTCRAGVAAMTSPSELADLEAVWSEVTDVVDRRPRSRWARPGRADQTWIRLVGATPALLVQFVLVVGVLTAAASLAAVRLETRTPFLLAAPLIVLGLVVVGFPPWREPTGQMGAATPLAGFRTFCIRAAVALLASVVPLAVASTLLPAQGWTAFAWVLPSLALTVVALVLSARHEPLTVVFVVGVGWVAALAAWRALAEGAVDARWMVTPAAQVVALAVLVASSWRLVTMRSTFDVLPVVSRGAAS
jgi:hypothetical protein